MSMISKTGAAIQRLFGEIVEAAAKKTGVIQRKRKFSAVSLARTFVLGYLKNPQATDEDLAQMAAQCGVDVTAQAIEQRHTAKMADFLKETFEHAAKEVVGSDRCLAPILERFTHVKILDGSTIKLPDSQKEAFPGCGGSYDANLAALKLQTELDLRSGGVTVQLEPGKSPDAATDRQHVRYGKGSLRITDLGYFKVGVFGEIAAAEEYFLSRLQFGTEVQLCEENGDLLGKSPGLLAWLNRQPGPFVDRPIHLGKEQKLPCRMIAWRLPEEQANRRRQKLKAETLSKKGRMPSDERLAWCDWTILVTNVPIELLTPAEAVVLYRARWQVELLFKRWKSLDRVALLKGSTDVRQMVRVWSRLLMALVQHWLLVGCAWGDPTKSLVKVCRAICDFAGRLAEGLSSGLGIESTIALIGRTIAKTCRRNKRSKPGTFELLNDVELLEFRLT